MALSDRTKIYRMETSPQNPDKAEHFMKDMPLFNILREVHWMGVGTLQGVHWSGRREYNGTALEKIRNCYWGVMVHPGLRCPILSCFKYKW